MLKDIPLSQLAVGMFVECCGDGSLRNPHRTVRAYIHSREDIEAFARDGAPSVVIDDEKTLAPASRHLPYPQRDTEMPRRAYESGLAHVQDVMDQVRRGSDVDFSHSYGTIDQLMEGIGENPAHMTLLAKLRTFDDYTYRHCLNVSLLSIIFGRHLGVSEADLRRLGFAGLYHDVGKYRVPVEILNKPGRLSDREFEVMKRHCILGYDLMRNQPAVDDDILLGILHHHERYDGKGYPLNVGQAGRDRFSPIICIVDIFDALTSERSYKKAFTPHDALKAMFCWRNETFMPGMLEKFVECFGVYPPGSLVRLSDQSHGLVLEANTVNPARPLVKICFNRRLKPIETTLLDLSRVPKAAEGGVDIEACLDPNAQHIQLLNFA